jgi:rhamnose transport system ATP-binding protein
MVGRDAPAVSARAAVAPGPVRLACRGITDSESAFQDVTLGVRAGEVLGLYGLVGAGRSEWAQGLLGLRQIESGEILLDGKPWAPAGSAAAARRGLVYLPEDRLRLGLFPGLSVIANAVVAVLRRISLGPFARPAEEMRVAGDVVRSLAVRLRSLGQPAATLSGGNQQKVILGRWLACDPSVLLLDEPTRGVDVGAKEEIHAALRRLAASGRAIVLISSDLTEVLAYSDRVGVFCEGRLTAEFDPRGATAEEVARAALPVGKADRESSSSPAPGSRETAWLSARSRDAAPLFAAVLLAAILSWRTDTFLQPATLIDIASSASLLTLCGLGAALVIVAGGIDISFGAVMALSAAAAGVLMREGWPPGLAALTALLVGAAAGATNAALTLAARVHPIVITLGTVSLYRGLTIRLVGARAIDDVPDAFRTPWLAAPLGVPAGVWLAVIAVAVAWWVLGTTVAGRSVVALGSNPRAAERVGISRSRTWLVVFALQGLLAALAGLQAMAATAHLQARDFEETTLEAIGVAVVGGIAITGGRGSVWGVVAAALLFRVLDKGWVLLHVPAFWQRTVVGGMLLLAILGDRLWRLVGGAKPQAAKSGGIRA